MADEQTPVNSVMVKIHLFYELPVGFNGGPQDVLDAMATADRAGLDPLAAFRGQIGVPWRYFLRAVVGTRIIGQILAQRWNGVRWEDVS